MSKKWVKVFSTPIVYIGELAKGLFEEENIKTFIVNKMDSMNIHLVNGEVEVYVQPEDVIRAKHLISKSKL